MTESLKKSQVNPDWETIKLGNVVRSVQINEYEPEKAGLTRYVAGEHIESENLFVTKYGEISKAKEVIGSAFIRRFSKGQILYVTRRAYLRKSSIATFDGICSNTTLVLETNDNGLISELLPFILQSENFINYAIQSSVGSTNPYVRWRDLANFTFKIPPEKEQRRISKILWSIEQALENSLRLSEKIILLKKSTMHNLLTKGIGNTEFKSVQSSIGNIKKIPKNWKICKLEDFCDIRTGGTPSTKHPEYYGGDIKWIRSGDVHKKIIYDVEGQITKEASEKSNAKPLPPNSIMMALSGQGITRGTVALLKIEAACNQSVAGIVIMDNTVPEYVYYHLDNRYNEFRNLTGDKDRTGLNLKLLKKIIVPIPPITEQQKIATIISKIDLNSRLVITHANKLKQLRKNLTNKLLSPSNDIREDMKIVH